MAHTSSPVLNTTTPSAFSASGSSLRSTSNGAPAPGTDEERLKKLKVLIREERDHDVVTRWIASNKDVARFASSIDGSTALHTAVEEENEAVATKLLRKKADVNAKRHNGDTPLHIVCEKGSLPIAMLLLRYNADPEVRNSAGLKPAELARRHRHTSLGTAIERAAIGAHALPRSERQTPVPSEASVSPATAPQPLLQIEPQTPPAATPQQTATPPHETQMLHMMQQMQHQMHQMQHMPQVQPPQQQAAESLSTLEAEIERLQTAMEAAQELQRVTLQKSNELGREKQQLEVEAVKHENQRKKWDEAEKQMQEQLKDMGGKIDEGRKKIEELQEALSTMEADLKSEQQRAESEREKFTLKLQEMEKAAEETHEAKKKQQEIAAERDKEKLRVKIQDEHLHDAATKLQEKDVALNEKTAKILILRRDLQLMKRAKESLKRSLTNAGEEVANQIRDPASDSEQIPWVEEGLKKVQGQFKNAVDQAEKDLQDLQVAAGQEKAVQTEAGTTKELEKLNKELQDALSSSDDLKEQLAIKTTESERVSLLEGEIAELEKEHNKNIAELQAQLAQRARDAEELQAQSQQRDEVLVSSAAKVQQTAQALKEQLAETQRNADLVQDECNRVKKQQVSDRELLAKKEGETAELQKEKLLLQSQLTKQQESEKVLQSQYDSVRYQLEQHISESEGVVAQLQSEYTAVKGQLEEKNAEKREERKSFTAQVAQGQSRETEMQASIDTLSVQLATLTKESETDKSELASFVARTEGLQAELKKVQQDCIEMQKKQQEVNISYEQVVDREKHLQSQLDRVSGLLTQKEAEVNQFCDLQRECAELKTKLQDRSNALEAAETQFAAASKDVESLKAETVCLQERANLGQEEQEQLKKQLQQAMSYPGDKQTAEFQKEKSALELQVVQLQQGEKVLQAHYEAVKQQLDQQVTESAEAAAEVVRLQSQNTAMKSKVTQAEAQIQHIADLEAEIGQLRKGEEALQAEYNSVKKQLECKLSTTSSSDHMKDELTNFRAREKSLLGELARLQAEKKDMQEELKRVQLPEQTDNKELVALRHNVAARLEDITVQKQLIDRLKAQLEEQMVVRREEVHQRAELEEHLKLHEQSIAVLKGRLQKAEEPVKTLDALRLQLENERARTTELQTKLNEALATQDTAIQHRITTLEQHLNTATADTLRLQKDNQKLQELERRARESENHLRTNLELRLHELGVRHEEERSSLEGELKHVRAQYSDVMQALNTLKEAQPQQRESLIPSSLPSTPSKDDYESYTVKTTVTAPTKSHIASTEVLQLQKEKAGLEFRLQEVQKQLDLTKSHEAALLQTTESLQEALSRHEEEKQQLQAQVAQRDGKRNQDEQRLAEVEERLEASKVAFKVEHEQTQIERAQKQKLQKEVVSLRSANKELEVAIQALKRGSDHQAGTEAALWKAKFVETSVRADEMEAALATQATSIPPVLALMQKEERDRGRLTAEATGEGNLIAENCVDEKARLKEAEQQRKAMVAREKRRVAASQVLGRQEMEERASISGEEKAVRDRLRSSSLTTTPQRLLPALDGFDPTCIKAVMVPDINEATGERCGTRSLSVATDPRVFYQEQCVLTGARINTCFLQQLPANRMDLMRVDIAHNYIGKKGIRAVLDVVRLCENVQVLDFSDNKLENGVVMWLADVVQDHPSVIWINLDTNLIAKMGGNRLLQLLREKTSLRHLSINNNPLLMAPLVRRIQHQVEANNSSQ